MRRLTKVPVDLKNRMGQVRFFIDSRAYWWSVDLAVALNVCEQTVRKWSLIGQIPPLEVIRGKSAVSDVAIAQLQQGGVKPIGGYTSITKEQAKALLANGYTVPKDATAKKKGVKK